MTIENRINEALRQLGEEHRLGMIKPEEFRSRRRALLSSWGERESTTSPGVRSLSTTQTNPAMLRTTPREPARATDRHWTAVAVAVSITIVAAVAAVWILKRPAPRGVSPVGTSAQATRSDELLAVMREATAFRNRNRWEATDTASFLAQWRALPPEDRRRAQQEPSLRSLRYELDQNIRAERQALEMTPNPEAQARLERLTAFARELTEEGS